VDEYACGIARERREALCGLKGPGPQNERIAVNDSRKWEVAGSDLSTHYSGYRSSIEQVIVLCCHLRKHLARNHRRPWFHYVTRLNSHTT